jgi:ABC-type Zn uptake system ZnuABC Zn-binding protein ZnuA
MNGKFVLAIVVAAFIASVQPAAGKVTVVSSSPDLASIAGIVGGSNIKVESIASGRANPHYVEVLPSYMIKVKRADVYLMVGLDLDRWARPIIDGSGNGKLVVVDCSQGIVPLNVPTQKVDASMGDIHPRGNPHYWLDPQNGAIVAATIADALSRVDAANLEAYASGLDRFRSLLDAKEREWALLKPQLEGLEIITFHDTWPYFSRAFGVTVAGFVEPKPGIEPTPSHTASIVELVKQKGIHMIGVEPYFSTRTPDAIARATGAHVVTIPTSVGGVKGADDYFTLFDTLLRLLAESGSN